MLGTRPYGLTGKRVSEIGFGAWQLGNGQDWGQHMSEREAVSLVHDALDLGCNFYDTAPGYGHGRSEEWLGKALQGRRNDVVINTKFGHHATGQTDFSPHLIRQSLKQSMDRLQTDYLDSVILHNPPSEQLDGDSPQMRELERLRQEGVILAYGASVDSAQDMRAVLDTVKAPVLEVLFNVFHQETADAFATAQMRNAALVIKVPLDSGWLSGRYGPDTRFDDIRSRWNSEVVARRFALLEKIRFAEQDAGSLSHAALRFILGHEAVSTVIPGSKTRQQLVDNVAAADGRLQPETMRRLRAFWEEEIASDPLPW